MSNAITGINSSVPNVTPQAAVQPNTSQSAPKAATVQHKADTVELSKTAQVRALKRSGSTVAQIALSVGLDVKTVNSYLGTVPAPAPAAVKLPTAPAPEVKQATAPLPQPVQVKAEAGK